MKYAVLSLAMAVSVLTGCASNSTCPCKNGSDAVEAKCCTMDFKKVDNAAFYKDGKLDAAKAKEAYFCMMKKLGAPVYAAYTKDDGFMWAIDFGRGDFASFGMAGVFWCNEKEEGYFAHEIFLLPGQSIAEHRHVATDKRSKIESWQVRYGCVYGFSEIGEANLDKFPEVKAMLSKESLDTLKSLHVEKWIADGTCRKLPKDGSWHFMMGGPCGAVVSEYATYHDNAGLRFANPNVKF